MIEALLAASLASGLGEFFRASEIASRAGAAWLNSPEHLRNWRAWLTFGIYAVLISFLAAWRIVSAQEWAQRWVAIIGAVILLAGGGVLVVAYGRLQRQRFTSRYAVEQQDKETESEDSSQRLKLDQLWVTTSDRLDLYHQIATRQAEQSFRHAQMAMAIGFATIVVAASVAAFAAKTTAGSIVSGVLGATGAAMAAYIGRTFVRSREIAAAHLRSYFLQPLEFSRYLAAERLIATLEPSARPAAVDHLAQAIVLGQLSDGIATNQASEPSD
ncbi:TRADD-N-associated membrane domain-containing protein [Streptomyces sp. NPDC000851]